VSEDNLSVNAATVRKEQVSEVNYNISLTMYRKKDYFDGISEVNFKFKNNKSPLTLDFKNGEISKVELNDKILTDYNVAQGFIEIPNKYLAKTNSLKVHYRQKYDKRSRGLSHFIDPKDQKEYIFSDNEPYDAHQFFPCFDQPNIKAVFQVTLDVPRKWKAINNTFSQSEVKKGSRRIVTFKRTKKMSTYLLFVGAGDYAVIKSKSGSVPMRIFVRQSLKKFLDAIEIFEVTKKGLTFYNSYFDYPYPFEKYDYIFAPSFGPGAMENPGAVTMNERMIYRGPVSRLVRAGRTNTILHEMVHMWFGDLVTMNWWNDLWLNESFATYLAYLGQDRALGDNHSWQSFYGSKNWAYWQDQLVTTHPIEVDENVDVKSAKANFDGITYSKGASSLKQLHFFVGEKAFKEGTRKYFKDNQWGNATREDFVGSIQTFTNKNLNTWTDKWLRTSGPNELKPKISCKNDLIEEFVLLQTKSSSGHYGPHQTLVGLYELNEKGLVRYATESAEITGRKARLDNLTGKRCPDFVFSNVDDYDYGLHYLDSKSKKTLLHHFDKIQDPLLKKMLWGTLYQMVYNYQLTPTDYLKIIESNITQIKSPEVLDVLLGRFGGVSQIFWNFMTKVDRNKWAPLLENLTYNKLKTLNKSEPTYLLWLDFYINISSTKRAQKYLSKFLTRNVPGGLKLDQQRRWNVLLQLAKFNSRNIKSLLRKELNRDSSDYGKMMTFTANVSIPSKDNKLKQWETLLNGNKPWHYKRTSFRHFHHVNYQTLSKEYLNRFFDLIVKLDKDKLTSSFVPRYFNLLPFFENTELLNISESRFHKYEKSLKATTIRAWLEANDMLTRRFKIMNL
jgi:aminopeptidase N